MKKFLFSFLFIIITISYSNAQKVHWSYKVEGSKDGVGAGAPNTLKEEYNEYCAAVLDENVEGKEPKKRAKSPEVIKYYFMPFDAQQVVVCENYNAGAIVKIEIESLSDNPKKPYIKSVYTGEASAVKGFRATNYNFEPTKQVYCVNVYLDYKKVPGVNQISGVGLTDFPEPYTPQINLSKENPFTGDVVYMNEDISGKLNPTSPIPTVDGNYIYFCHQDNQNNNQIYKGTIGANKTFIRVELSDFNLPQRMSTSTAITSISQDNNIAYVNDMTVGRPIVYKTYLKKDKKGKKSKWVREPVEVKGFESISRVLSDCMSYDGQYYLVNMEKKDGEEKYFGSDIYVGFRNEKGVYENFVRLGFDINTIGDEIPCFLAADNKTLVFASTGQLGYGDKDIYITKRLDDTWQNWSQPINLGDIINTKEEEDYFTLDSKGENAYFVRSDNLYRINLKKPEKETPKTQTIKPEPIVIIKGKVLDKRTNEPLQADIVYTDILTGKVMGRATSNGETGEYSVALPAGKFYSYLAEADNYVPVSENVDAREITETMVIEKDLYLVPKEVGQTIRLNNIFFDFAKATLRPESNEELDKVLKLLNDNPKMEIEISGHTDNVGSDAFNLKLSDGRANAVRTYLISKGIAETRITAKGYGETKPVATNDTDEGRQTNRRVEFTITK
jgi:outer membrane protein OmpA-like peptidoglycan-associated protein